MSDSIITVKKSYSDGKVAININLKCQGWNSESAKITARTDITTGEARVIAAALFEYADKADEAVAKKAAAGERRKKWLEREIAAGRMIVFGGGHDR